MLDADVILPGDLRRSGAEAIYVMLGLIDPVRLSVLALYPYPPVMIIGLDRRLAHSGRPLVARDSND